MSLPLTPQSKGFVAMSHAYLESFSIGGVIFGPEEDGLFYIPAALLSSALDHGFTIAEGPPQWPQAILSPSRRPRRGSE